MKHIAYLAVVCLLIACNNNYSKTTKENQAHQPQSTLYLSNPVISGKAPNASQLLQVYRYDVTGACYPNVSINGIYPITQPGGMIPKAAWVGDFSGGDFAEVTWTVQDLTEKSYRLWAVNGTDKTRSPRGKLSIIVLWENP